MSAWWFDADGLSAHYQNPFLISSKPFQVTGILFEQDVSSEERGIQSIQSRRSQRLDKATRQRLRSGQRIPLSELRKHLSVRQQKLVELFFGQRIEELEEKSVSLPKIDEEEKCQPVDEKEEFDVVSQADDASQEEDIEEESIPEEDEENTPHVAGIDDAAME